MKKIVALLIACVLVVVCATGFVGCGQDGKNGAEGKSAYQIWVENGYSGTEQDFLNWLKGAAGEKGDKGDQGKSAYEIFKDNYPDYTGSETEWIYAIATNDLVALFGRDCVKDGHNYDEGVITKQPTRSEDGEKIYTCKNCKKRKIEVIPKIGLPIDKIYEENGKKYVDFGSYPQTHVSDETLLSELNALTETNERGYYEYNGEEYAKITAKPSKSGSYKDKQGKTVYYKYSDGAKITFNIVEWFKVEPIKWKVLEEDNESIKVVSTLILDASRYYKNSDNRNIDGATIYPNNYKYSTLREFLNNGFYNFAFTSVQQNAIIMTEVDNNAKTTESSSNKYACENTLDKMYALSYSEASKFGYLKSNTEKQFKVTDFAKAKGAYYDMENYENCGNWWLRSPCDSQDNYALCVSYGGGYSKQYVSFDIYYGVVPAMQISIA